MKGISHFRDFALSTGSIYFESTRAEKLRRIADLSCTHFIDDLEEVLTDPGFPRGVVPILFANGASAPAAARCVVCRSWRDIEERIFGHG